MLASLNHPNIAQIHGIEKSDDTQALVLELVEGPTLADRIAKGPIPLDEALPIAKQIAEALEAAHEAGVIHRDLKPANIKVRDDGTVKVLDFGLAKAFQPGGSDPSDSPTVTVSATASGVIMGTAAYMSPEQARGKPVDKRADIWAFGVVLYEMLSGQRMFGGRDVSETLAAVMMKEPDWSAVPPDVPPQIDRLLRRCSQREPTDRLRDIGEARIELSTPSSVTSAAPAPEPQTTVDAAGPAWTRGAPWAAAALVAVVAGVAGWTLRPELPRPVTRVSLSLPSDAPHVGASGGALAVSPDGRTIVYAAAVSDGANGETGRQLYMRRLDQLDAQSIPGTEGAWNPFFSPDGEWIAFTSTPDRELRRVSIDGGPVQTLATNAVTVGKGDWGPGDTIVFTGRLEDGGWGLFRVSGAGGATEVVSAPEADQPYHVFPDVLPSGDVLFTIEAADGQTARVALLSADTGRSRTIINRGRNARYVASGHLTYFVDGTLMAAPFDASRGELTGDAVPIVEGISGRLASGQMSYGIGDDGSFVYVGGEPEDRGGRDSILVRVNPDGGEETLPLPPNPYSQPRLSPDGTRLAVRVQSADMDDRQEALWVYDVATGAGLRLTNEAAVWTPVWTPDSRRLLFGWNVGGAAYELHSVPADGSGPPEALVAGDPAPVGDFPTSVTPDGKTLIFSRQFFSDHQEVWELSLDGDAIARPVVEGAFRRSSGALSPDGNWLAYAAGLICQRVAHSGFRCSGVSRRTRRPPADAQNQRANR